MRSLASLLRSLVRGAGAPPPAPSRRDGLDSETAFWDGWLARQEHAGFAFRTDPTSQLQPWLWCHLDSTRPIHRVLDVGSGPLSVVGRVAPSGRLELTCCDPLASVYRSLLAKHGITPVHEIDEVAGEALVQRYGYAGFDLALSNNAVDHAASPIDVLRQMALVVRVGGTVLVQVGEREGQHGGYGGLHQWDFWEDRGRLWLAARAGDPADVTHALEPWLEQCSIARVDTNPAGVRWDRPHLRIVWRRRDAH